ncbi:MAG TPA: MFS transporter [Phycisphaerae bacterium]|nr:MFS transporter [Phycisphaerae bacterium]
MCASKADGAAFSVMVGAGETYLPAFTLAVGLGQVFAGLVATIPMLAGAILQLLAPRIIRVVGSHRRWVILCAAFQGLAFLPLCIAAYVGRVPWYVLFLIATIYWGAGMGAGPAWNTWMGRAIPRALRPSFFARRTRIAQMSVLSGLLIGGLTLRLTGLRGDVLGGFAILFGIACCARIVSTIFLARQSEPEVAAHTDERVSLIHFANQLRRPEGHLLLYMLFAQLTTQLAAPFFSPYMLGQIKLSYTIYILLLGTAFLAKAATLSIMAKWGGRIGAKTVLWIGGIGIIPLPALWLFSTSPLYLMGLQMLSGAMWACYEYATLLLLFETIRDEQRTAILTSYNLMNSLSIATGSVVGGLILRGVGPGAQGYLLLFLISSVCRLCVVPLMWRVGAAPRRLMTMWMRPLAVRPSAGSVERPIVAAMDGDSDVEAL